MGKAGRAAGRAPSLVVPTSMKRKDEGLALEMCSITSAESTILRVSTDEDKNKECQYQSKEHIAGKAFTPETSGSTDCLVYRIIRLKDTAGRSLGWSHPAEQNKAEAFWFLERDPPPGRQSLQCSQCNFDVSLSSSDPEVECAIQFRRIGDKLNFRQKLLNLISKLFRSGT
ncbi:hypothetical protein EI555_002666 [Monodon monoceros]|uniref:Uncharacterized protein n=1 Tax=Monodon monoceros TaxID=40151 RepID=A0A4U1FHE6_MONMO|nr:hypothetical protein EI555_002666 [Monodon monoceros]